MNEKIYMICPGYNCSNYINQWWNSLVAQNIPMTVIAIDDCSLDDTHKKLQKLSHPNINLKVSRNIRNMGPAFSRIKAWHYCDDSEGICINVDMDDWLDAKAVRLILKHYQNPNVLVTMGRIHNLRKRYYTDEQINNNQFDQLKTYGCEMPYSYRRKMVAQIPYNSFLDEKGNYLQCCTDVPMGLGLLRQIRADQLSRIKTPIYHYRIRKDSVGVKFKRRPIFKRLVKEFSDGVYSNGLND